MNFEFETMFETGVDENNWDDTVSLFQRFCCYVFKKMDIVLFF